MVKLWRRGPGQTIRVNSMPPLLLALLIIAAPLSAHTPALTQYREHISVQGGDGNSPALATVTVAVNATPASSYLQPLRGVMTAAGATAFRVSLVRGRLPSSWRARHTPMGPSGTQLVAWLTCGGSGDDDDDDDGRDRLAAGLHGLYGVAANDGTSTWAVAPMNLSSLPIPMFDRGGERPGGVGSAGQCTHVTWLPGAGGCADNLAAVLRSLPCGAHAGVGSALTPDVVFSTSYHEVAVLARLQGDGMLEVEVVVAVVAPPATVAALLQRSRNARPCALCTPTNLTETAFGSGSPGMAATATWSCASRGASVVKVDVDASPPVGDACVSLEAGGDSAATCTAADRQSYLNAADAAARGTRATASAVPSTVTISRFSSGSQLTVVALHTCLHRSDVATTAVNTQRHGSSSAPDGVACDGIGSGCSSDDGDSPLDSGGVDYVVVETFPAFLLPLLHLSHVHVSRHCDSTLGRCASDTHDGDGDGDNGWPLLDCPFVVNVSVFTNGSTAVQTVVTLPLHATLCISTPARRGLRHVDEYPPDPNRGLDVPPVLARGVWVGSEVVYSDPMEVRSDAVGWKATSLGQPAALPRCPSLSCETELLCCVRVCLPLCVGCAYLCVCCVFVCLYRCVFVSWMSQRRTSACP